MHAFTCFPVVLNWLTNLLLGMSAVAALHGVIFNSQLFMRGNSLMFSSPPSDLQSQNASKSEDQSELLSRFKSLELDNKNLHKGTYEKRQRYMAVPKPSKFHT